jgi:FAD synthase
MQCLRDEMKFKGVEALLEQIHADIEKMREILKWQSLCKRLGS